MFEKRRFVSFSLAVLIAFTALSSVVHLKQKHTTFSSDKSYVTATQSHQSTEFTTVKSEDLTQTNYSTLKIDNETFVLSHFSPSRVVVSFLDGASIFHTLYHLNTAIFKLLFPFHSFW